MRSLGGNKNMAFLLDDDGAVLSLMDMKVARETEVRYPATFHVGFMQEVKRRSTESTSA